MIITGAGGLIGSEACRYFGERGWKIYGIDNNQRAVFFGPEGDTKSVVAELKNSSLKFEHLNFDIRDRQAILKLFESVRPDAVVHTAGQPSHDLAAKIPFDDFETNATGTLNLLEAARQFAFKAPFVYMSTNKVYGDAPNEISLNELETRWDYKDPKFKEGIDEFMRVDQCKHSLFGASKLAADVMVQEYGRYFGMYTCALRCGCLTGPKHRGVELHGFLQYLIKCNIVGRPYKVYGYKGKQVRDNIHALDVIRFIEAFIEKPRCGEVYNIGGGKGNTCSILEAFQMTEALTGKKMIYEYVDEARSGDHICYYSDLRKSKQHYPGWDITVSLPAIFEDIVKAAAHS